MKQDAAPVVRSTAVVRKAEWLPDTYFPSTESQKSMATNTLTDAKCKSAKPGEKLVKMFDGGGLHLAVLPSGVKSWRVAYRMAGSPQTMSLGPYPDVGLAEARAKRDTLKGTLRDGGDPMAPRRAKRSGMTLAQGCEAFWGGRDDITPSYRDNAKRALELHLYPTLGDRPIASIDKADLMTALDRMDAAGLREFVRKVRMWVSQVFEWAVARDECRLNPAALIDPRKAFGKTRVEHFPSLTLPEIPGLMQRLALEGDLQSALACRLLALTWVRTTELRMMLWSELDGDLWRIPAGRMKRAKDHLIPLSPQALAILRKLKARSNGSLYVLPAEHRGDRPMSENTILMLFARTGFKGRMTGHGWRTVASTWANEAGYKDDAIERQLAHSPDDKVRAAYNRAEFLPERRAMLLAWADWLDATEVAG
jgi:integrase